MSLIKVRLGRGVPPIKFNDYYWRGDLICTSLSQSYFTFQPFKKERNIKGKKATR